MSQKIFRAKNRIFARWELLDPTKTSLPFYLDK